MHCEVQATFTKADFAREIGVAAEGATADELADFPCRQNIAYEELSVPERLEDPVFTEVRQLKTW